MVLSFKGLVAESGALYGVTSNLKMFIDLWGIRNVLCSLGEDDSLKLHF